MVRPKSKVCRVLMVGPLVPFADELSSMLSAAGYAPLSISNQLRLLAHVSRWIHGHDYAVADLTDEVLQEYLVAARAAGRVSLCSNAGLTHLLRVLPIPQADPDPPAESAAERLLASFGQHLLNERGLAASTTAAYLLRASRFLAWAAADGNVAALTTGDVTRAVMRESQSMSVGSAQFFVAALRSFLRFCFVEGLIAVDLAPAALAVTGRRRSTLPQGISPRDARDLLRACDRRQAAGRRDYAVIMTLLRLGLRAQEVANLTLDDIDWRAAEIVVHGKGNRDERLPLPTEVGEAIVGYLQRGRPETTSRGLFLRSVAPTGPLGRGGVSGIVRYASVRAGLTPMGAHRLRHTLACDMVAANVPARRDLARPTATSPAFFVSSTGAALMYSGVLSSFVELTTALGLRTALVQPRMHDLRHSFAVQTLLDWYRAGVDVNGQMMVLSTYLGHVHPAGTYWYLSAAPELMELAAARLTSHAGPRS